MKPGKIEHGIPTPPRRGGEYAKDLYEKLAALQPGDSLHVEYEPKERRKNARWAINSAALRQLGKGNYAIRGTETGARVWRLEQSTPSQPTKPLGGRRNYDRARRKMLSLKPGQSAVFSLDVLNERQVGNMAYNGLGKGHFRTQRTGNEIRVWRQ